MTNCLLAPNIRCPLPEHTQKELELTYKPDAEGEKSMVFGLVDNQKYTVYTVHFEPRSFAHNAITLCKKIWCTMLAAKAGWWDEGS